MEGGAPLNDGRKNKSSDIVLPMPTMERVTVRVVKFYPPKKAYGDYPD